MVKMLCGYDKCDWSTEIEAEKNENATMLNVLLALTEYQVHCILEHNVKDPKILTEENKQPIKTTGIKKCEVCNGTGVVDLSKMFPDMNFPSKNEPCEICNGTGVVAEAKR